MSNLGKLGLNPQKGTMPVLQWMPPSMLAIDGSYQRTIDNPASAKLILQIAKFWDWNLCQPLVVSRRPDGTQWIVDGQHRLAAAVMRGDIQQLPCFICNYPDAATEAQRFVDFNGNRKALRPLDLWKAAVASNDPVALQIVAALNDAGLKLHHSSNNRSMPVDNVTNLGGLQRCYKKQGLDQLSASLHILGRAFRGEVLQYSGTLFTGIASIIENECKNILPIDFLQSARASFLVEMLQSEKQAEWFNMLQVDIAENGGVRQQAAERVFGQKWQAWNAMEIVDGSKPVAPRAVINIPKLEPVPPPKPVSLDPLAKSIIEKHGIARPAGAKA